MLRCLASLLVIAFLGASVLAQDKKPEYTFIIKGDKVDRENVVVVVPVTMPLVQPVAQPQSRVVLISLGDGVSAYGHLTPSGIRTEAGRDIKKFGWGHFDLHLILDKLPANKEIKATYTLEPAISSPFVNTRWMPQAKGTLTELLERGVKKPMLGYAAQPYDDSSADARNRTYKVFHHLWSPDGKQCVTNGGHTDDLPQGTKLQYPHHRGLYFGFNKVSYDNGKKKADTWHCQKDDHISHQNTISREGGPVLGRHRVLLHWHGPGKEVFAHEEREVTVYNTWRGTLVEWSTLLKTTGGPVTLDGDPQHAGFQFRAANEVAVKHEKETYFLRPDGKGKPNETRNWPGDKKHVNLPWNAMCFKLGDKRYTVAYLDHPSNPREARHSERAYGRFGYYFKYELTKEKPLRLSYRLWLQEGEMTGEQVAKLHRDFVDPPKVEVKMK